MKHDTLFALMGAPRTMRLVQSALGTGLALFIALAGFVGALPVRAEHARLGCDPPPEEAFERGAALALPETDETALRAAIAAERPSAAPPTGVTGVLVPHHLLAADLIARGIWAASTGAYDRIILLAPDHFGFVSKGAATVSGCVETLLGPVTLDEIGNVLAENSAAIHVHPHIMAEHGVSALLPFVADIFPDTPVLPIVTSMRAGMAEWRTIADTLRPVVTDRTLIIQSTDFGHFLTETEAAFVDQESLAALATGDWRSIAALGQPRHLDAMGAHLIMHWLQDEVFAADHAILANRTSVDYGGTPDNVTTYIVGAYHPDPAALSALRHNDVAVFYVGGDVLLGRFMLPMLASAEDMARVLNAALDASAGGPVLANLEGVITTGEIVGAPSRAHIMPSDLALPALRSLNIMALSHANNHSHDLGAEGVAMTRRLLAEQDIPLIGHGHLADLGALRVYALNMVLNGGPETAEITEAELCGHQAEPPLVAFLHWGEEYTSSPSDRERAVADSFARCGFSVVIGAHSHQASAEVEVALGRMPWVFSVGNLLFDQRADRASGALAELRIFPRGTVALRLIPIPNLFELGAHQY